MVAFSISKSKWSFVLQLKRDKLFFFSCFLILSNCFLLNRENINLSCSSQNIFYILQLIICKTTSFFYFNYLIDLTAVHYPNEWFSFKLKYILRNFKEKKVLLFSFFLGYPAHSVSCSSWYRAANWLEREVYDMFGVWFFNHSNLRRILTDYGFKGFPLKKDFPVFGYKELRFDFEKQHLIYTPVISTQKWRNYVFLRQWN